ncbi:hypothetical protein [Ferviditalea candida]|uniref:Uncharacterized protein n=1 Tax=Ferviditalea candida TaxID=3108399 RepID=A0ABU5ZN13_9BACL|nr:hypothetical protein [Paenibacillaceae bacterium T2]
MRQLDTLRKVVPTIVYPAPTSRTSLNRGSCSPRRQVHFAVDDVVDDAQNVLDVAGLKLAGCQLSGPLVLQLLVQAELFALAALQRVVDARCRGAAAGTDSLAVVAVAGVPVIANPLSIYFLKI